MKRNRTDQQGSGERGKNQRDCVDPMSEVVGLSEGLGERDRQQERE
jgi:hypothetical protein